MECLKTIQVRVLCECQYGQVCSHWIGQPAIPMTEDLDVLFLLTDGATIARWNNEKLPSDRMSVENATILKCRALATHD